MSDKISLEEVIRAAIRSYVNEIHTSIPVIVENVYSDSTVDLSISVKRTKKDRTEYAAPVLSRVPVMNIGNSNYEISFPISKGDEGLAIFSERDISRFIKNGSISSPAMIRKHEYSDALFIPSSLSNQKRTGVSPSDGISIVDKISGNYIRMNSSGVEISSGSAKIVISNSMIEIFGTVMFESIPGSGVADTTLNTHLHVSSSAGSPSSQPIAGS